MLLGPRRHVVVPGDDPRVLPQIEPELPSCGGGNTRRLHRRPSAAEPLRVVPDVTATVPSYVPGAAVAGMSNDEPDRPHRARPADRTDRTARADRAGATPAAASGVAGRITARPPDSSRAHSAPVCRRRLLAESTCPLPSARSLASTPHLLERVRGPDQDDRIQPLAAPARSLPMRPRQSRRHRAPRS